jgi:hypothetical protein
MMAKTDPSKLKHLGAKATLQIIVKLTMSHCAGRLSRDHSLHSQCPSHTALYWAVPGSCCAGSARHHTLHPVPAQPTNIHAHAHKCRQQGFKLNKNSGEQASQQIFGNCVHVAAAGCDGMTQSHGTIPVCQTGGCTHSYCHCQWTGNPSGTALQHLHGMCATWGSQVQRQHTLKHVLLHRTSPAAAWAALKVAGAGVAAAAVVDWSGWTVASLTMPSCWCWCCCCC